jgi:hypothetical protein
MKYWKLWYRSGRCLASTAAPIRPSSPSHPSGGRLSTCTTSRSSLPLSSSISSRKATPSYSRLPKNR